jgi:4-hydroxybenzoate polyprenyltransferase
MSLFGLFLLHPDILARPSSEEVGIAVVGTFVVFLVWQTAVVFDDVFDRGQEAPPAYLTFGSLTAVVALLAATPMGGVPLLLAFVAVYLAIDYPRLRRKHYLLSGVVIGFSSCTAFLFGAMLPIRSASSSEPLACIALAILVTFFGASFLKDVTSVDADAKSGISTIFTMFGTKHALPIVATLVAFGFTIPALFFNNLADQLLLLTAGIGIWLLIVLLKDRSYEPVLALYFIEGFLVFLKKFIITLS